MKKKKCFAFAVPGDECLYARQILKDNSTRPGVTKVDLNDNRFIRYIHVYNCTAATHTQREKCILIIITSHTTIQEYHFMFFTLSCYNYL